MWQSVLRRVFLCTVFIACAMNIWYISSSHLISKERFVFTPSVLILFTDLIYWYVTGWAKLIMFAFGAALLLISENQVWVYIFFCLLWPILERCNSRLSPKPTHILSSGMDYILRGWIYLCQTALHGPAEKTFKKLRHWIWCFCNDEQIEMQHLCPQLEWIANNGWCEWINDGMISPPRQTSAPLSFIQMLWEMDSFTIPPPAGGIYHVYNKQLPMQKYFLSLY